MQHFEDEIHADLLKTAENVSKEAAPWKNKLLAPALGLGMALAPGAKAQQPKEPTPQTQQMKSETPQKPTEPAKIEPAKQEQEGFSTSEETDPLRDTTAVVYQLKGKFLKKPQRVTADIPVMILKCQKGVFQHGTAAGKLVAGYIYVGDVVGSGGASAGRVHVQFKLDGGKLQDAYWNNSTDFSSIFFSELDLNNLFYGHMLPHKPDTGPQVQKVLIGVQEFLGGEVVMEFDLPNIENVADSCGCINHIKNRLKK